MYNIKHKQILCIGTFNSGHCYEAGIVTKQAEVWIKRVPNERTGGEGSKEERHEEGSLTGTRLEKQHSLNWMTANGVLTNNGVFYDCVAFILPHRSV